MQDRCRSPLAGSGHIFKKKKEMKEMSTTIYLIRHGQSLANEQGVFLGQGDLDLTQLGRDQAEKTAQFLKDQVGRPDAIYSSDLARAYGTALATARRFDMPVVEERGLREIWAGEWEFVPFGDLLERFGDSYRLWMDDIGHARCDGGESVEQLQQRVVSTAARIARRHENGVVFLFSHATPIRTFAAHCRGGDPLEQIGRTPWPTNASVTRAVYDRGNFRLEEYSRDDFMGELITNLPANV